jgi:hypothetical protein
VPALNHPVFGSCRLSTKGYPRINGGAHADKYLHRAVFELIAGRPVREGFHIHHMNGKLCFCGHQLVELEAALHPAPEPIRHPYSGRFMTASEYERSMGEPHYRVLQTQTQEAMA